VIQHNCTCKVECTAQGVGLWIRSITAPDLDPIFLDRTNADLTFLTGLSNLVPNLVLGHYLYNSYDVIFDLCCNILVFNTLLS
jgi:hypothetical protein